MGEIALRQLAAVRAYREAHPEVDWTCHVVVLKRDGDGWIGVTHAPGNHLFERQHAADRAT